MNRRRFLRSTGALLGASPLVGTSHADAVADAFHAAVPSAPWLTALQSVAQSSYDNTVEVAGTWPKELQGTLYRNGPARHEIGDFRYRHWFDGDGMLHAYRLGGDTLRHQARMIGTTKYKAEMAAGRALYPGFASVPPNPAPVTSADAVNSGNISVLHHHGKLMALWEAGSPWEMDADTLDTKGAYSFSPDTDGAPFSAHPRVEPDGTLWNFGYVSSANLLALWHIDPRGKVVKVGTIPADPITMPHDFVVTSKHIVMLLPPLHYRGGDAASFLDSHEWVPSDPTRVLVVDKNDFSNYQWYELPAQWVFHFGNAWEDERGIIRFDAARAPSPHLMQDNFKRYMLGETGPDRESRHFAYRLDTKSGKVAEAPMFGPTFSSEFPCVDPRVSCRKNRRLVMLHREADNQAAHPFLAGVTVFDADSEQRSSFNYPPTVIPEEHLFVPRPSSAPESEGWVIGTALDYGRLNMQINVFDVANVADGPVATATLPYTLPLGLHGKFVEHPA